MNDNSSLQIINSERAVGTILSNFSSDFIMDVIGDHLKMKFRPFTPGSPNYVIVLENNFNIAKATNPAFIDKIEDVRGKTYKEIIDKICSFYNLEFIGEQVQEYTSNDFFNLASILFDVFVSNFTPRMIEFFVRYIMNNKDDIYNSIDGAEEFRKNKEATSYGRKMYTDGKLVVIHANLNSVLDNIAGHDIPFNVLLHYIMDSGMAGYLLSVLNDAGDLYKYHYASYINNPTTRPELFTAIKLSMQRIASDRPIDPTQFVE